MGVVKTWKGFLSVILYRDRFLRVGGSISYNIFNIFHSVNNGMKSLI